MEWDKISKRNKTKYHKFGFEKQKDSKNMEKSGNIDFG
jgi:hypothetical protein